MHTAKDRRRRRSISAKPADGGPAEDGWIAIAGQGSGFHDCPLCRELASGGGAIETVVGISPEGLPELLRSGWLDDLVALVGLNATVQLMGSDLQGQPIEVISMATFLARLGYE